MKTFGIFTIDDHLQVLHLLHSFVRDFATVFSQHFVDLIPHFLLNLVVGGQGVKNKR